MKKALFIFVLLLLFNSCKNDDDGIDCALFDPITKSLYINLVDSDDNNLIENETYNADDITVLYNNNTFTNVFFNNIPSLENLIALKISGTQGDNTYEIQLSENLTYSLILDLTLESTVCDISFFTLNSVSYNDIIQTIEDFNGDYLITIVK
jgi:hypothetical protein